MLVLAAAMVMVAFPAAADHQQVPAARQPSASDAKSDSQPLEVTAAAMADWPPHYITGPDGRPTGFAIEVLEGVAERAGLKIAYRKAESWSAAFELLRTGEVDLIPNLGRTAERDSFAMFTSPVETFRIAAFIRGSAKGIGSAADLAGHVVGVVRDNAGAELMRPRRDLSTVEFDNLDTALLALLSGQIEALVYPEPLVIGLARRVGLDQRIRMLEPPLAEIKRSIAVGLGREALLERLESGVREFVGTPAYRAIYSRWYHREMALWEDERILWPAGAGLAILIFGVIGWHLFRVIRLNRQLVAIGRSREKALADLRDSEARYRTLIENSPLATMIARRDGRRVFVNHAYARLLGYASPDELLNLPSAPQAALVVAPHDQARIATYREALFEGRPCPPTYELDAVRKDGTIVPVLAFGQRITWEGEPALERTFIDLSDRRKAEAALRESEAMFRHVFEAGGTGIVVRSMDGRIVKANQAMADFLGYQPDDLLGMHVMDFVPPEDFESTHSRVDRLSRGDLRTTTVERRYVRRDGATVWAISNTAIACDPQGKPCYVVTTVRDINERKLAEEALAESEARYRALVEQFPLGIQIFGEDGARLFINQAFSDLVGHASSAEAMAMPRGAFIPPEDRGMQRGWRAAIFGGSDENVNPEMRLVKRDGSYVPVQSFTRRVVWAGRPAIQRTYVDLTERKKTEADLRASEERFRTVFEAGGAGMALYDSSGRYVRVNKAYCDLIGYSAEEIVGRVPLDFSHPNDYAATAAQIQATKAGESTGHIREKRYMRKDGTTVWAITCVVVARDGATGERYQIGIVHDITERKRAEQAVAESEARFREMVEQFPLAIQIFSEDGTRLLVNRAFADLLGYPDSAAALASPPGTAVAPEHLARLRRQRDRWFAESGGDDSSEVVLLHRDGRRIPTQAFGRRVTWAGRTALQRTYVDLTERKQAEAALRSSEERFRTVFEASGAGMTLCDMDSRYIKVNRAFCELVGYTEEELTGRTAAELSHPDDWQQTAESNRAMRSGTSRGFIREKRYLRKDGGTVWVIVCIMVARDGPAGEPYQIGIIQDITERKRAEQALAESRERLLNAQRIARIGNWERDFARDRLSWSDEVHRICGVDRDAPLSFSWFVETLVHPDDRERVMQAVSWALASGQPYRIDHRLVRTDGEVLVVHEEGEVTLGPDGEPVRFAGTIQDVSDLHRARAALEVSEARFRGIFEAGGAAIVLIDAEGRIQEFNRAFADFLGYPEGDLVRGRIQDLIHPEDAEDARRECRGLFAHEIAHLQVEHRFVRRDGATVWADISATVMGDMPGQPPVMIGIIQDITQRKLADAAVAQKNDLLDLMRALTTAANRSSSFEEAMQDCLDRVCAFTGWPVGHAFERSEADPDILRPMQVWHISDPARFAEFRAATETMVLRSGIGTPGLAVQSGDVEWRVNIPDDRRLRTARWDAGIGSGLKSGFAAPVMAGDRIVAVLEFYATELVPRDEGIVAVIRQAGTELGRVYERERSERELLHREAQLRQIIDNVPHWIYIKDRDGRYLLANQAMASAYGAPIDQLVGRTQMELYGDKAQAAAILANDRSIIISGQMSVAPHASFILRDGTRRNLRITKMPYTTQSGEVAVLGIAEDITEQLMAEEERRHAQRMDALGKLTGGVAHDFNNLLTIILGNLQLLERRLKDEPLRTLAETAERAARRGADVTRRLLAFARSQPLEPRPVDLNALVRDMTALVERSLGSGIEIRTVLALDLWRTRADPGQIENALINLVVNARDAMPDGGRLIIETANVVIGEHSRPVGTLVPGDYVSMAVIDTGIGMSPDVIARAVEPFFTTKEIGKGSGLGLSMVYGFVRQSGGDLEIESVRGAGTTVRLYLPRNAGETATESEEEGVLPAGGRETVLLVEDDPDVRAFARAALANLDYTVIEAESALRALDILEAPGPVHLLFTDVTLSGGMDGQTLARAARRRVPEIEVILTSGHLDRPQTKDSPVENAVFLQKPYTQKDLATIIRDVFDHKRRREA